jgi:UDP-N-acetylglucosamine acyltransferase
MPGLNRDLKKRNSNQYLKGNKNFHPTAIIYPGSEIDSEVKIGPFSIIGPYVKIGKGSVLHSHVNIEGHTTIGENNQFFPFCSIGGPPQDLSYKGEPTKVEIGNNNIFREYVSINRGTLKENQLTKIGNNILLMSYVHLGHDVCMGDFCVIANSVNIAGHVKIGERCIIGGGTNIGQFVTLGKGAYIGGGSAIDKDVPLFCTAVGNRVRLKGINIIGLRRQGFGKNIISEVVDFFRQMEASALSPRTFITRIEVIEEFKDNEIIKEMIASIEKSEIGIAPFAP